MKSNEQTIQQIERFITKVAQKYPKSEENMLMTDVHVRVSQDTGDLMAFDDDDNEITRCVVEEWIDSKEPDFYDSVAALLRNELVRLKSKVEELGIMKPYNFVLEDDEKESVAELYVVDDDTIIIGGDLMEGLDKDLDAFLDDLLKD